jgi:hypothetical protein
MVQYTYTGGTYIYTKFIGVYLQVFSKLNRNLIYGVWRDILEIDGAGRMNVRTTSWNGRTVKGNGGRSVCIHFLTILYISYRRHKQDATLRKS